MGCVVGNEFLCGANKFISIGCHSQVVRQRSATPLSPVQIWLAPLLNPSTLGNGGEGFFATIQNQVAIVCEEGERQ